MADLGTVRVNIRTGVLRAVKTLRFPTYQVAALTETERQDGVWSGTVRYPDSSLAIGVRLTIHLIPSGVVVGKTFTDGNGEYRFTGLNIVTRSYFVVCHDPKLSPDYQYIIRSYIP